MSLSDSVPFCKDQVEKVLINGTLMRCYKKSPVTSFLTVLVIFLLNGCVISIELGGKPGPPLTGEEIFQINNPSPELLTKVESYLGPALEFIALAELNGRNEGRPLSASEAAFAKEIGIDDI